MSALRLIVWLLLAGVWARADIRVTGSDVLGPALPVVLQDYAGRNELTLTVKLEGSHAGWEDLRAGRAEVALLSFPPSETLPGTPYICLPIAYHTTVVLVPAGQPLEQISFGRLAGIFGVAGKAEFRRWGEFGLTGEWTARPIAPMALGVQAGLAQAIFRHLVLAGGGLQGAVGERASAGGLLDRLAVEAGGIALAATVPLGESRVQALSVARDDRAVAYAPSAENIHRGDYPLRWPVYVVVRRADAPRLFGLLRYLLGEEVAGALAQAGLTPAPRGARNEQIFDLELL